MGRLSLLPSFAPGVYLKSLSPSCPPSDERPVKYEVQLLPFHDGALGHAFGMCVGQRRIGSRRQRVVVVMASLFPSHSDWHHQISALVLPFLKQQSQMAPSVPWNVEWDPFNPGSRKMWRDKEASTQPMLI